MLLANKLAFIVISNLVLLMFDGQHVNSQIYPDSYAYYENDRPDPYRDGYWDPYAYNEVLTEKPWRWGRSKPKRPVMDEIRDNNIKPKLKAKPCGETKPINSQRVVGGREAVEEEFPWIVSLMNKNSEGEDQHICGAAIINSRWIITAGHCLERMKATDLKGVVGTTNLKQKNQEIKFDRLIRHEKYGKGRRGETLNDIALLRSATELDLSENSVLNSICLPTQGQTFSGVMSIAGWGKTSEIDASTSDVLRTADVFMFGDESCTANYKRSFVPRIMICAGRTKGGVDSCEADSGGPLMKSNKEGKIYLAGLVSFGIGCARPKYPGVYTKVSTFVDWINKHIR